MKAPPIGSVEDFEVIAAACERGAPMFEDLHRILKDQASGKRNTRNAYATILWLHVLPKLGKQKIGKFLSILVECADSAFDKPQEILAVETFELTRQRYQKRWPEDYQRKLGEASRSRGPLIPEQAAMWRRLDQDDCHSIVESLQPLFNREITRATGT